MTKASKKLLEAFEMWTWQRMLKISWTEVTNEEVLAHANKTSIFKHNWCIDGLDMFSGMTTYSVTLLTGKCWARLLVVGKGWSYCMI